MKMPQLLSIFFIFTLFPLVIFAEVTNPAVDQCPVISTNLWIGVNGLQVTLLQEYLRSTGDYTYPEITGYFGKVTEAAVQRFQSRMGIVSTGDAASTGFGAVGSRTRALILQPCTPTPPSSTTNIASTPEITRRLSIGTSGEDVRLLQEYLRSTGDYTYPEITGYFGKVTEAAVQRFQSRMGIVSTGDAASTGFGAVGPKTLAGLMKIVRTLVASNITPPVSQPSPRGSGSGIIAPVSIGGGNTAPTPLSSTGGSTNTTSTEGSSSGSSTVSPSNTTSSASGGSNSTTTTNATSQGTTTPSTSQVSTSTTTAFANIFTLDASGCFSLSKISTAEANTWLAMTTSELQTKASLVSALNPTCIAFSAGTSTNHTTHLRLGATLASLTNREFKLSAGTYSIGAPISLLSNTKISGIATTTITGGAAQIVSLFKIEPNATNITVQNLVLKEGGGLSTGHISLEGSNSNILIDRVQFIGDVSKGSATGAAVRAPREMISELTIRNSTFAHIPYGFSSNANVNGLTITNNDFSGWTHYAVLLSPGAASTGTRSERIAVNSNYFHDPDIGPDGQALLLITRGTSRQYVQTVTINNNRVDGPGIAYPTPKPAGYSNALGDLFVLHGVNGFTIDSNIMKGGSENGISVTRLSRNGTISNNELFDMDAFGINIGSGYYEVTVDSTANLHVGDIVRGAVSGTEAPIVAIIGNILGLNPVANNIFRNESLTNLATGQSNAATITAVDRTKLITIDSNKIYNNGRNRGNELSTVWEVIVMHSDSIDFHRNQIYSTIHQPKTTAYNTFVINNSRNIGMYDDNIIQNGTFSPTEVITRNSATWLKGEQ